MRTLYRSVMATFVLIVLCCGVYPLTITLFARAFFPGEARGGILYRDHQPIGAVLIGQAFSQPGYFHGRPSAAGSGYDASNSSGSNLGPTNQKLYDAVKTNAQRLQQENVGLSAGQIPVDLLTASGSGLDPHISPAGAAVQVTRVAEARGLSVDRVRQLVSEQTESPQWGIFGDPRVNVLKLNLALDQEKK